MFVDRKRLNLDYPKKYFQKKTISFIIRAKLEHFGQTVLL